MKDIRQLIGLLSMILLLNACGGGGGGDNTTTAPAGSSNWDEMTWDQDNWA